MSVLKRGVPQLVFKILSDLILKGKTDVVDDVSVLGFQRFARGELLHETALL